MNKNYGYQSPNSLFSRLIHRYWCGSFWLSLLLVLYTSLGCINSYANDEDDAHAEPHARFKVALLAPDSGEFWQRVIELSKKAAEDLEIEMDVVSNAQTGTQMVAAARQVIKRGARGIITHGSDMGLLDVLSIAEEHQIPVMVINSDATQGKIRPREEYKYWIGSILPNDYEAGRTLTRRLVRLAENQQRRKHHVLAVGGWPEDVLTDSGQVRLNGMADFLSAYENVESLSIQYANWDPQKAQTLALEAIRANPNLSIIWAANDQMAHAIIDGLEEHRLGHNILVGGVDWNESSLDYLRSGKLGVSVGGHFLDGAWATILLYDYLSGVDFSFQQLEFESLMTSVEKETLSRVEVLFSAKPKSIDFSTYSLALNESEQSYDFNFQRLLQSEARRTLKLSPTQKRWVRNAGPIRVAVYGDLAPLAYFDRGQFSGIASGYLDETALLYPLKFQFIPFSDVRLVSHALAEGQVDLVASGADDFAINKRLLVTEPYAEFPMVVIADKDSPIVRSMLDLTGRRVGLVSDEHSSRLNALIENEHPNILFERFGSFSDAVDAIDTQRVSAVIYDLAIATHQIYHKNHDNLSVQMKTPYHREYVFGVHAANPELKGVLNSVIGGLHRQKKIAIQNNWLRVTLNEASSYDYLFKYFILALVGFLIVFILGLIYVNHLRKAQAAIKMADQAKTDFLANMSHEIRTPMNAIIGMTAQAIKKAEDDRQRELLDKVKISASHLLTIINDILDFSKVESGNLTLENRRIELNDLLTDIADVMRHKAAEKNIQFVYVVDLGAPSYFYGDEVRIKQILINLIGNALKFTPSGGHVSVAIGFESIGGVRRVRIAVKDTGIGISQEAITKLFKPFSQSDESTTRRFGGTGLGLSISKQLVKLMGGDIWVDSVEGKGSQFSFYLPYQKTNEEWKSYLDVCCGYLERYGGDVYLLLSEDEYVIFITQDLCRNNNIKLITLSQREPLDQYIGQNIRIVLLDLDRAGDSIDRIHHIVGQCDSPVLTLGCEAPMLEQSRALPRHRHVPTPFSPIDLARSVDKLLIDDVADLEDESIVRAESEVLSYRTLAGLRVLLVEDNKMNQELATMILDDQKCQVSIAGNGREALTQLGADGFSEGEFGVRDQVGGGKFDIILMDCQMPVMDGYEATKLIRKNADYKSLPIIAMTANAMSGDKEKALAVGMNDYLTKPIDETVFLETLLKWKNSP